MVSRRFVPRCIWPDLQQTCNLVATLHLSSRLHTSCVCAASALKIRPVLSAHAFTRAASANMSNYRDASLCSLRRFVITRAIPATCCRLHAHFQTAFVMVSRDIFGAILLVFSDCFWFAPDSGAEPPEYLYIVAFALIFITFTYAAFSFASQAKYSILMAAFISRS